MEALHLPRIHHIMPEDMLTSWQQVEHGPAVKLSGCVLKNRAKPWSVEASRLAAVFENCRRPPLGMSVASVASVA